MCNRVVRMYIVAQFAYFKQKLIITKQYCSRMKNKFSGSKTFKAFQNGDQHALQIIFYELSDVLVPFSYRITRNWKQSEDIFAVAFMKLYRKASEKESYKHFGNELYKAVRNSSINYYKREGKRTVPIDEEQQLRPSEDPVADLTLHRDVMNTILRKIKHLPPRQKEIAEYLFLKKKSMEEVADILGLDEKTVRNQKALIWNKFKEVFKRIGLSIFICF